MRSSAACVRREMDNSNLDRANEIRRNWPDPQLSRYWVAQHTAKQDSVVQQSL